eukprot:2165419-Prymnesium_polylepis.1
MVRGSGAGVPAADETAVAWPDCLPRWPRQRVGEYLLLTYVLQTTFGAVFVFCQTPPTAFAVGSSPA